MLKTRPQRLSHMMLKIPLPKARAVQMLALWLGIVLVIVALVSDVTWTYLSQSGNGRAFFSTGFWETPPPDTGAIFIAGLKIAGTWRAAEPETLAGVAGQVCVQNVGQEATENLNITLVVQVSPDGQTYADLFSYPLALEPASIGLEELICYQYKFLFDTDPALMHRLAARIHADNLIGWAPGTRLCPGIEICPFVPELVIDFTLPEPVVKTPECCSTDRQIQPPADVPPADDQVIDNRVEETPAPEVTVSPTVTTTLEISPTATLTPTLEITSTVIITATPTVTATLTITVTPTLTPTLVITNTDRITGVDEISATATISPAVEAVAPPAIIAESTPAPDTSGVPDTSGQPPPPATDTQCVYSFAYWRQKEVRWPAASVKLGWFKYTREKALKLMAQFDPKNGTQQLAIQYITARLNAANGADVAGINRVLREAKRWFLRYPFGSKAGNAAGQRAAQLAAKLELFNSGKKDMPLCKDNPPLDDSIPSVQSVPPPTSVPQPSVEPAVIIDTVVPPTPPPAAEETPVATELPPTEPAVTEAPPVTTPPTEPPTEEPTEEPTEPPADRPDPTQPPEEPPPPTETTPIPVPQ